MTAGRMRTSRRERSSSAIGASSYSGTPTAIRTSPRTSLVESTGAARPPPLGQPHRRGLGARRRARAATTRAGPRDGRRGGDEGGAALSARRRAARGARRTGLPGDDRRRAAGAAAHQRAGRPATARDRGGERGARGARRADRAADAARRLWPRPPRGPRGDRCARHAGAAAPLPRTGGGARRRGPGARRDPSRRAAGANRARARRHGPRRRGQRGGDRPPRRACHAARRHRRRDAAGRDGSVAARDRRLGGLAPRDARRAVARGARPTFRRLARTQPPALRGPPARLSLRPGGCRADRALAAAARLLGLAGSRAQSSAPYVAGDADGGGRARGAAVRRPRRGPAPRDRAAPARPSTSHSTHW